MTGQFLEGAVLQHILQVGHFNDGTANDTGGNVANKMIYEYDAQRHGGHFSRGQTALARGLCMKMTRRMFKAMEPLGWMRATDSGFFAATSCRLLGAGMLSAARASS